MTLAPTLLLHEASTTGGDPVTTSGSVTTVAGRYYEVVVECSNVTVTTVTLPGTVPLTQIHTHIRGTLTRVTALGGIATAGGTGTITIDFSGSTTGTVTHVTEWTGHDATTPFIAANIIQGDASDATAPSEVSITLPNALTRAGNAIRLAASCNSGTTWTPGTDFTELGDATYATPSRTMATQYDIGPADLVADGSFAAASQWAAIAWEVNEAAVGGVTVKQLAALGVG